MKKALLCLATLALTSTCETKKPSAQQAATSCNTMTENQCRMDSKCGWDYNEQRCKNAGDISTYTQRSCSELTVLDCRSRSDCEVIGVAGSERCQTRGSLGNQTLICSNYYVPNCPAGCASPPSVQPSIPNQPYNQQQGAQCVDQSLIPPGGGMTPYPYPFPPGGQQGGSIMPQLLIGGLLGGVSGLMSGGVLGGLGGLAQGALGALGGMSGGFSPLGGGGYSPYSPYQPNPYQPNPYQPNPYQPNPYQPQNCSQFTIQQQCVQPCRWMGTYCSN